MSNSMYGYRRCCGDHFHVTGAGEDLIGGRFETEAEAKGAADLLNAGATLDSALVGTDAPKPAPSPHGQDVEALVRAGTHVVVSTREWAYALQAMGIPEDRWQPDTLRSRPVEPEPVAPAWQPVAVGAYMRATKPVPPVSPRCSICGALEGRGRSCPECETFQRGLEEDDENGPEPEFGRR